MFKNLDFTILEDKNFKEDSVREEIIVPIINKLGYSATGEHKIIRSKGLKHPFVMIGTTKKPITIIPDYILSPNSSDYWVLDAKAPTENIYSGKNVEQAYSYAIHPEIRVKFFALCNGKDFVLYHVLRKDPILDFKIRDINNNLEKLIRLLHPEFLASFELVNYYQDWGLHLKRMGLDNKKYIYFCKPQSVAKIEDDKYMMISGIDTGGGQFCLSFDFDGFKYKQLLSILPTQLSSELKVALSKQPFSVFLKNAPEIEIGSTLSDVIQSNPEEDFLPFIVDYFRFNHLSD